MSGGTPGVLLFHKTPAVIKTYDHVKSAYAIRTNELQEDFVDPKTMETLVAKIGSRILIRGRFVAASLVRLASSSSLDEANIQGAWLLESWWMNAPHFFVLATDVVQQDQIEEDFLLLATLRIPDQGTLVQDDLVPIFVTGFNIHQRSNDMESMEDDDLATGSKRRTIPFNIPIQHIFSAYDDPEGPHFHGLACA